jgi:GTPase SAR1 family protein
MTKDGESVCAWILELFQDECTLITPDMVPDIKLFWADPGIQECYANRSKFQLNDSAEYFFLKIDEMIEEDWLPNYEDILRTRVRTTGILERNFEIENNPFRIFDVGGQRSERKKWIHCFQGVTAVLFVAALNEFDQVLFEDEKVNRMTEALDLYGEIVNSEWFKKTSVILFLNKSDLFEDKIAHSNINESPCVDLQAFTGDPRSYEETVTFIASCFEARVQKNPPGEFYAYPTCATNAENVTFVFNTVKEIIITQSLQDAGLMV